jgi:hypothetical protein
MKKHILNRPMFKQVKSPAYGTGIASNLVSSEERQRYNYGGRVRAADGLFTRADAIKQAEKDVFRSPFQKDIGYGLYKAGDYMQDYLFQPLITGGDKLEDYLTGSEYGKDKKWFGDTDTYGKMYEKYVKPRVTEIWREKGEEGLTQQHPREMLEASVAVDDKSDVLDMFYNEQETEVEHYPQGRDIITETIKKELDPAADLKVEPKEDAIAKLLREQEERAKKRGKIAALTQGVSMASNLLSEPTFAKAVAAAGKEAPQLAKAYSDEVKSAEGLPLQWDMIKEKIRLEGEQAIKKAEVGEERKAAYQSGYLNYLNASLNELKTNPVATVTSVFEAKTNKALSLSATDQVNALSQLASQKGKVIDIQAIDISKKENYKNIRKGTIVRDTKTTGQWYIMDEEGVLSKPTSVLDITTKIDDMPMVTKP